MTDNAASACIIARIQARPPRSDADVVSRLRNLERTAGLPGDAVHSCGDHALLHGVYLDHARGEDIDDPPTMVMKCAWAAAYAAELETGRNFLYNAKMAWANVSSAKIKPCSHQHGMEQFGDRPGRLANGYEPVGASAIAKVLL